MTTPTPVSQVAPKQVPDLSNNENLISLPPLGETATPYFQWINGIMEGIDDGVVTVDQEGMVTSMNRAAEQMTGWKSNDALCMALTEIFTLMEEHSQVLVRSPVMKSIFKKQSVVLPPDTALLRQDNTRLLVEGHAFPMFDASQEIIGASLVFRDITEKVNANRLIYRLLRSLKLACRNSGFNVFYSNS